MTRSIRTLSAAAVMAAAIALAGCAGPATTAPPSSTVAPATGATVTGDGYSYQVPDGWQQQDASVAGQGVDSVALSDTPVDGFASNVNVVKSPAGALSNDQVESLGVPELENAGATDVTVDPRYPVAGSDASHLSATFSSNGTEYIIEQYYVSTADQTYVVTFSFSPSVSEDERTSTAESVLATWTWS